LINLSKLVEQFARGPVGVVVVGKDQNRDAPPLVNFLFSVTLLNQNINRQGTTVLQ